MLLPQGRVNVIDLMNIAGMDDSFPERDLWILAGATPATWEMVVQGSTGFSGSFARQATLNADTAALPLTARILDALELAASEGAVRLQGEGVRIEAGAAKSLALEFSDGSYRARDSEDIFSPGGPDPTVGRGQPDRHADGPGRHQRRRGQPATRRCGRWSPFTPSFAKWTFPFLSERSTLRLNARHVRGGASIFIDGRLADGTVACDEGSFPTAIPRSSSSH